MKHEIKKLNLPVIVIKIIDIFSQLVCTMYIQFNNTKTFCTKKELLRFLIQDILMSNYTKEQIFKYIFKCNYCP